MMEKFVKFCLVFLLTLCLSSVAKTQNTTSGDSMTGSDSNTSKIKLNVASDIMSRYIWRGTDYGNAPSIQPTLSLSLSNFEVGCWSAIATNSFYKEVDLFAKYTYKNVSLIFTDYYIPSMNGSPSSPDVKYFHYSDKETAHSFEGSVLFKGGDKIPLWLLGGVFFYGNDKRWGYDVEKDTTNKTYYSSYFEMGYTFAIKENSADLFVGFTPMAGAYGDELGIINVGLTGYRKVKISPDFELPVKTSLIFNPQTSNVFIAFGITL